MWDVEARLNEIGHAWQCFRRRTRTLTTSRLSTNLRSMHSPCLAERYLYTRAFLISTLSRAMPGSGAWFWQHRLLELENPIRSSNRWSALYNFRTKLDQPL